MALSLTKDEFWERLTDSRREALFKLALEKDAQEWQPEVIFQNGRCSIPAKPIGEMVWKVMRHMVDLAYRTPWKPASGRASTSTANSVPE